MFVLSLQLVKGARSVFWRANLEEEAGDRQDMYGLWRADLECRQPVQTGRLIADREASTDSRMLGINLQASRQRPLILVLARPRHPDGDAGKWTVGLDHQRRADGNGPVRQADVPTLVGGWG